MKKDMRKAMAPKPAKSSLKIKAKSPMMNTMSLGAANAPMDPDRKSTRLNSSH